jgi:undecaprenyl-diphosphatase
VVAAVALIGRRTAGRDAVRATVVGLGSLFVVAVGVSRIYFGLHWLSDVTASLLLGIGFGGVLHLQSATKRVLLRSLALVAIPSLYLTAACGFRVTLPSPAPPALSPVRPGLPSPHPEGRPGLMPRSKIPDVVRVGSASYAA